MKNKKFEYIFAILFGGYIAVVLWVTLFSRLGAGVKSFLLPFYSYTRILKGDWKFLLEDIGNIVLLFPLGIALNQVGIKKVKKIALIGISTSLCIETFQFIFALGTFEMDDLLHNTLGVVFGFWFAKRININVRVILDNKLKGLILISVLLGLLIPFTYKGIQYQKMLKYASMNDRVDGSKNLLILDGKNGKAWDTDVYIKYLENGSINIKGTSDKMSWWPIGDVTLEAGVYSFSGLSGVKSETVGLELVTDNSRLASDVGPVDKVVLSLSKTTKIKVYVIVYDGCKCDVFARPVIYREG